MKQHHQQQVNHHHTRKQHHKGGMFFNYVVIGTACVLVAFLFTKPELVRTGTAPGYQAVDMGTHDGYDEPAAGEYKEAVIKIKNGAFVPATLEIQAGTTVTFENEDNAPHQAMSDNYGSMNEVNFDTDVLPYERKIPTVEYGLPGTYTYHDRFNPQMKGTIVVK